MFLKHRETYGKARLLLADEVGVGKTLSLAASAMVSALLDDGPVLILCPSTLTFQWQVELKDKLGIPSAVWLSTKKVWMDHNGHTIKTRGAEDITRCPFRIAIVSTGLIVKNPTSVTFCWSGGSELSFLTKHIRPVAEVDWAKKKQSPTTCSTSCSTSARVQKTFCSPPRHQSKRKFLNCGISCGS